VCRSLYSAVLLKQRLPVVLQIVPGNDNSVAIELISTHVRRQLKERSNRFRQRLAVPPICDRLSNPKGGFGSLRLTVLPQTPQLKVGETTFVLQATSDLDGHPRGSTPS
jgi:hypothetical protein